MAKKRWWRRLLRVFVIVTLSVLALAVIGVGFLHTRWGKEFVRGRLERSMAERVDGRVRIGSLDYTFMLGSIRVGDIEIQDAAGQPAIRIGRLDLAIDRGSLFGDEVVIDALAIHGLDVSVRRSADGSSNLTGLFKPAERSSTQAVRVARFALDGRVRLVDPDGREVAIDELALTGSLRSGADALTLALDRIGAQVAVATPGQPTRTVDVGVETLRLDRAATGLALDAGAIVVGPLAIAAIEARVALAEAARTEPHRVAVRGARVDHQQLTALLGRAVLIDDVALDATLVGPRDALVLDGDVRTGASRLALDGRADLAAARPAYQLTLVGTDLRPAQVAHLGTLPDLAGELRLEARGTGYRPGAREGQVEVALRALGTELSASASLAVDEAFHGRLSVHGAPAEVLAALVGAGIAVPPDATRLVAQLPPRLELAVEAAGRADGEVAVTVAPTRLALARGTVALHGQAVLRDGEVQTGTAHVALSSLDLRALARLAGRRPTTRGSLSGTLALHQTGTRTRGDYALTLALAEPALTVRARGSGDATTVVTHATVDHRGTRLATVDGRVPVARRADGLALRRTGAWTLAIEVPRVDVATLGALVPPPQRATLPPGEIALRVDVAGTPARPTARFTARAADRDRQVALTGTLTSTATAFALTTAATLGLGDDPLARVDATITAPRVAGLDVAALRTRAQVDARIDVPARRLATLASLAPELARFDAELGGQVGGHVAIAGRWPALRYDGVLRWDDYRTAAGTLGHTELTAVGTADALDATLRHNDALVVTTHLARGHDDRIAGTAAIQADTALVPLLPALLASRLAGVEPGHLRADLASTFVLRRDARGVTLDDSEVTGSLGLRGGSFRLPGSDRHYRDLALDVTAVPRGVAVALEAHERGLDQRDRRLEAEGLVSFAQRKPAQVELAIRARDWLLSGAVFGAADAPRATLDGDVEVAVDLTAAVPRIDATVHRLALLSPDRAELTLQREPADDVIFVEPGAPRALPVAKAASGGASWPMDLHVHIPAPIRLQQGVLDVWAQGDLAIRARDSDTVTRGRIAMTGGSMKLFGEELALREGALAFSDEDPGGMIALEFARPLPDAVVRNLTAAGDTALARATLAGPVTGMKMTMSGGTNVELPDAVATNTLGHARYVTAPGLPVSESVQAPHGIQVLMLAYFATAMPQLLFLDRFAAWSDPTDGRYGVIEHVEAERDVDGARARIRVVARPPTPGRSAVDLGYERVLRSDARTSAGVGARVGSRGGGGLGVFIEWSSAR